MDKGHGPTPIVLKALCVYRFDHNANCGVKVRNVSKVGSQKTLAQSLFLRRRNIYGLFSRETLLLIASGGGLGLCAYAGTAEERLRAQPS